jgi:hypothetical protein
MTPKKELKGLDILEAEFQKVLGQMMRYNNKHGHTPVLKQYEEKLDKLREQIKDARIKMIRGKKQ